MDTEAKVTICYDSETNVCSDSCCFLSDDETCLLFNETLEETQLPKNWEWNDRNPTKQRCWRCIQMSTQER